MIVLTIGGQEREIESIDEQWINQQINQRRAAGEDVCVRVTIRQNNLNLSLATPTCPGGGRGRPPLPEEQEVLDLWKARGLNDVNFSGGSVVAFLKQLKRL